MTDMTTNMVDIEDDALWLAANAEQVALREPRGPRRARREDVTVTEKRCGGPCGRTKSAAEFHLHHVSKSRDGLQSLCIECNIAKIARAAEVNVNHPARQASHLNCTYPGHEGTRLLPRDRFADNRSTPSGKHAYCRACEADKRRARMAAQAAQVAP